MLTIQLGDLATRIVRGLGIRGRIPTQLDEVAVPVVVVQDLTDALFAQNPATFAIPNSAVGAAASVATSTICNNTPNTIVSLDTLTIQNTQAVADTFTVIIGRGTVPGGLAKAGAVLNQQSPAAVPPNAFVSSGSGGVGGGSQATVLSILVPAGASVSTPIGAILYPHDCVICNSTVAAVTASMITNWIGREFARI
jgi:hypothetical protein